MCRGWPYIAPPSDYVENWTASNANWTYDGDEDFTTYPDYLSVLAPATSTYPVFNPATNALSPYPLVPSSPNRLRLYSKVRTLIPAAAANTTVYSPTISVDAGYVGDYINLLWGYSAVTGNYTMEMLTQKNGVAGSVVYDTGIARVDDRQDDIIIEVGSVDWRVLLNGVPVMWDSGYDFSEIAYMDCGIQRFAANRQGMLNRTEIYTRGV